MKLPEKNIYTETSNIGTESSFSIGDKGFIFSILRNKLYSDPISSLIREYGCNAKDANVEAGRSELPIEIHLPNSFDMSLKIRDTGLGITPDRMNDVFINYGSSTKRNTNDQAGAFGIGSKSSFAYTNQFSVVTVSDFQNERKRRTYIAYIDATEEGKMRLVSEENTTDPTGTEIIIGVEKEDVSKFIEKTLSTFKYWKVKPILSGINPVPEFPQYENNLLLTGSNWSLYSQTNKNGYNTAETAKILIDGVCYNIDVHNFNKETYEIKNLLNSNVIFDFKIGELTISANRETLHYDDNTIYLIITRLHSVAKETPELIQEKVKNSKNYIDASRNYRKLLSAINYIKHEDLDINWDGKSLLRTNYLDFGTNPPNFFSFTFLYRNSSRTYKEVLSCLGAEKASQSYRRVHVDIDIPVYINDLPEKESPRSRVKTILKEVDVNKVQVLHFSGDNDYKKLRDKYLESKNIDLDWLEPKLLSTIKPFKEQIVRKPSVPKEKGTITVYKYDDHYRSPKQFTHKFWRPEVIEESDDSIEELYVVFNNASDKAIRSTTGKYNFHTSDISKISKYLNKTIYGVRETDLSKLGKKFVKLEKFVDDKIKNMLTSGVTEGDILVIKHLEQILSQLELTHQIIEAGQKSKSKGVFSAFLKEYDRIMNIRDNNKDIILYETTQLSFSIYENNIYKLGSNVKENYPLIRYLHVGYGTSRTDFVECITEYIESIDKTKIIPLSKTGT